MLVGHPFDTVKVSEGVTCARVIADFITNNKLYYHHYHAGKVTDTRYKRNQD